MKIICTNFLLLFSIALFAQVDTASYNVGYKIGENIPVAILLIVAIIFIIRGYRRRGAKPQETDFMNDGTIEK